MAQVQQRKPQKILVIGPAWVGDMILAQSLFKALKRGNPSCHLSVAAPDFTKPLLAFMPEVDEALSLPFRHGEARLADRWRFGRNLRQAGFDRGIVLPGSFKAALPLRAAGIPLRSGYRGEARGLLLNDCRPDDKRGRRAVDRFVALAEPPGTAPRTVPETVEAPRLLVPEKGVETACEALGLSRPKGPLLILCPGAEYGPAKQWPARHFASVARQWLSMGGALRVMGGPKDRPIADALLSMLDSPEGVEDLVGRTTLAQAVALLSQADMVITNDSGLMHVAGALGRRLIALYGPSDERLTPPLAEDAEVLSLDLPCRPCHARRCPLIHHRCMENLEPSLVGERLSPMLDRARS